MNIKPVVLCILDGVGLGDLTETNAVYAAKTPTLDYLIRSYPHSRIKCSGIDVGLPDHQMGNSEVGHLNIGAGRVVNQSLSLINLAVEEGEFFANEAFIEAITHAKKNNKALHLMGVLSDGGIHSQIDHLKELLLMASMYNVEKVCLHAFMDGRDTAIDSGVGFIKDIQEFMEELECGEIASISGRYYATDRDNHFERNFETYKVMVLREGASFDDPVKYIEDSYKEGIYDEFIVPAYNANAHDQIGDGDSVIFYNFRPDRAIQLASILTNPNYKKVFEHQPKDLHFVSMMEYDKSVIGKVAFKHEPLNNVMGPYLSSLGKKQLRIAETEKYAHVTFFLDGQIKYDGKNAPELEGCKRILIDSPRVDTYDMQPEMSAYAVKDALISELNKNYLDLAVVNFANGDMVGHTGNLEAAIKAMEVLDECLKELYDTVEKLGGVIVLTADHGNCEVMRDGNNQKMTTHTNNETLVVITKDDLSLADGRLSDIVPTVFTLMGVPQPEEMTGKSLIIGG